MQSFPSFAALPLSLALISLAMLVSPAAAAPAPKPLKIYILAGQSNMEGHAKVETFDYIGDDPATAPLLKQMRGADGKPTVCEHVWISYFTGTGEANGEGFGKLTAGYGSRQKPDQDGGKIGPEFTFGLTLDAELDQPILLIKTAWGGKSLYYDFRPPSAGVYQRTAKDIEKGQNPEAQCGHYYRLMVDHVRRVLSDIKRVCPVYDEAQGFELAGFVWLQGWNDMVNRDVYPIPKKEDKTPRYADYSRWLSNFIRDVRKDFKAPRLPFVIGVMGVEGSKPNEHVAAFREAMAAPAALPEFQGNVFAVSTAPFWSMELGAIADKKDQGRQMRYYLDSKHKDHANADGHMTEEQKREFVKEYEAKVISPAEVALWNCGASNAGYHYLGCAKTFALMGQAFAEILLKAGKR
ncbi:carbohydrate esterase-like sialic acid-specific acetylesterase [Roseimicrobium gellanilyticum]|uniref:Carbohydrate esterase-like sialic acid-specific acetylesterase n=1 Tax=Roseimicrobium gellanilyticum TaxID=748857 RepID=A0A366HSS2_9BACT|nr:sialate O-acetylesterase [Roseimicrobium gellanilyticum]RBP47326.1 carbohydrate esterase-like sialic acid-specific acetylesterase [Roseimicrobium gellanilyticum]